MRNRERRELRPVELHNLADELARIDHYEQGYMLTALQRELRAAARDGYLDPRGEDAAKVELATIVAERIDEATTDVARGGARAVPVTALDAMARLLLAIDARRREATPYVPERLQGREVHPVQWHQDAVSCTLSCGHDAEDWQDFCGICGRPILWGYEEGADDGE